MEDARVWNHIRLSLNLNSWYSGKSHGWRNLVGTVHGVTKSRTRLSDFTFTFHFHALEKEMAAHSSSLAWKIPWMEEPGGLQSMGSHRVGHDWATSLSLFTFMHWRRKWQPTPVFLPGESQGWEAWWAAVYGVTQSLTRLKRLSSSSVLFQALCSVLGKQSGADLIPVFRSSQWE